jgi:hypothetical protein
VNMSWSHTYTENPPCKLTWDAGRCNSVRDGRPELAHYKAILLPRRRVSQEWACYILANSAIGMDSYIS